MFNILFYIYFLLKTSEFLSENKDTNQVQQNTPTEKNVAVSEKSEFLDADLPHKTPVSWGYRRDVCSTIDVAGEYYHQKRVRFQASWK